MGKKRKTSRTEKQDEHLRKLQELTEADLEERVLVPLFRSFGYHSVERYGGPDEHGIDIICWKTDEIDEIEVAVVQVKRFKPARKSASDKSFAGLLTQIAQASDEEIPHKNGMRYPVRTVYFVTPYALHTRTLKTRFAKVSALKAQGLKIIDGNKLEEQINKHLPAIARELFGGLPDMKAVMVGHLTNEILMKALKSRRSHPIEDFYTDIDFSVGNPNTRLFLLANLSPSETRTSLDPSEWIEFKELSRLCEKTLGILLSKQKCKEIETDYEDSTEMRKWKKTQREMSAIQKRIVGLRKKQEEYNGKLERNKTVLRMVEPKAAITRDVEACSSELLRRESAEERGHYLKSKDFADLSNKIRGDVKYLKDDNREMGEEVAEAFAKSCGVIGEEVKLTRTLKVLGNTTVPSYTVQIAAKELCEVLRKKRRQVLDTLERFRKTEPTRETLKAFLEETNAILQCVSHLFATGYILQSVLEKRGTRHIQDTEACRLKISVHRIFDCELNTMVLGDAGAGKTTSLQMYARIKEKEPGEDRIHFYIPLTWLMTAASTEAERKDVSNDEKLLRLLMAYFASKECYVSYEDMSELFRSGRLVLILDGIDEVIATASRLNQAILATSQKYPATQIITSCRVSAYLRSTLPFTTVTLLPFSPAQRNAFIRGWFSGKRDEDKSKEIIIAHLKSNSELVKIVNNPLLATLLCTLQENGIKLPDNEVRLYNSRLDLLLGTYDVHKKAMRLKSYSEDMSTMAEYIAYRLHKEHKREEKLSTLYAMVEERAKNKESRARYCMAIDELIDPCEVLVPMTDDGRLGFGHLRYQEHLAARYLRVHRSTDLLSYARERSWHESFVFLARMHTDIDWLVGLLAANAYKPCERLIHAIIATQPSEERQRLKSVVKSHRILDNLDKIILDDDLLYGSSYEWEKLDYIEDLDESFEGIRGYRPSSD